MGLGDVVADVAKRQAQQRAQQEAQEELERQMAEAEANAKGGRKMTYAELQGVRHLYHASRVAPRPVPRLPPRGCRG